MQYIGYIYSIFKYSVIMRCFSQNNHSPTSSTKTPKSQRGAGSSSLPKTSSSASSVSIIRWQSQNFTLLWTVLEREGCSHQLQEQPWVGVDDDDVQPLHGLLHQSLLLLPVVIWLPVFFLHPSKTFQKLACGNHLSYSALVYVGHTRTSSWKLTQNHITGQTSS